MSTATLGRVQRGTPTVLAAVAAGYRRVRDIAAQTRRPDAVVRAELAAEVESGRLTRTGFGGYALTGAGRAHVMAVISAARHQPLDPDTADTATLWEHRVARSILPGSRLTDPQHRPGVEQHVLQLNPAAHTLDDVVRWTGRIASALGRPAEQVIAEVHPSQVHSLVRLLLVGDDSPLYRTLEHPGAAAFDPATGQVGIGLYADAEPMRWALWNEQGAVNSVVTGAQESGTSTVLRGVLAAVADSDIVDARAIDLAGVSGLVATGQPTAVTRDDALEMLAEVQHQVHQRLWDADEAAAAGVQPPNPDRPLLLVVLSDAHLLFDNSAAVRLVSQIQRLGRKAGAAVVTEARSMTLNTFGSDSGLRAGLCTGNLAVLRQRQDALPTRPTIMDPVGLPEVWHTGQGTAGVGYTPQRTAAFRAYHVPTSW